MNVVLTDCKYILDLGLTFRDQPMKLRQLLTSSSFSIALVALACTPAFAADSDAPMSPSTQAAPTKKSVRVANRAFSRTVQKAVLKTKGLEQATISVFGNAKTGQVVLAGQIASEDQDGLAVNAAKQVNGVTSVSSKLTLREEGGS
jgi:osmotically-inducible protein OsmY